MWAWLNLSPGPAANIWKCQPILCFFRAYSSTEVPSLVQDEKPGSFGAKYRKILELNRQRLSAITFSVPGFVHQTPGRNNV